MDEDVRALLKAWGLADYIEIFNANKIDVDSLAFLDANLARELISPIGDRAKFLRNLDNWKSETGAAGGLNCSITEELPDKFVDILNESHKKIPLEEITNLFPLNSAVSSPSPSSSSTETTCDSLQLEELLRETADGKSIINAHRESGILSSSSRRKLTNIIVKHLLNDDPEKRIASTILADYAQQIRCMFPKENISTYFIPYVNNSRLKIKRCAKGKLYDCLQNRRREYREANQASKIKTTITPDLTPDNNAIGEEGSNEDDINFLMISCEPWSLIEEKWSKTVRYRLRVLTESHMTVADYMTLYPALKKPTGYHLLIQDFNHLYPNEKGYFNENFQLHRHKLLNTLLKKNQNNNDPTIKEIVLKFHKHYITDADVKSEIATSIEILTLLALTLAQPQSKTKKSIWRPSKIESKDGFITHITRPMDLVETIRRRRDKFATLGVTLQPFILIVGPSVTDIQAYYIVVNETFYIVNSILEAVDTCFKIIFSLHCNYPQESVAVWTFIQKAFFKIKTAWDKEFVVVNTLLSDFM